MDVAREKSQNRQSGNLNSCARATGAGTPKVGGFRTAPEKEAGVARDHGSQRGRHAARWAGTHGQNAGGGEQTATPQTTRIALRAPLGGGSISGEEGTGEVPNRHPRGSIAIRTGLEERHFSNAREGRGRPFLSRPLAANAPRPPLRTKIGFFRPLTRTRHLSLRRMVSGGPRSRETRSQTSST